MITRAETRMVYSTVTFRMIKGLGPLLRLMTGIIPMPPGFPEEGTSTTTTARFPSSSRGRDLQEKRLGASHTNLFKKNIFIVTYIWAATARPCRRKKTALILIQ